MSVQKNRSWRLSLLSLTLVVPMLFSNAQVHADELTIEIDNTSSTIPKENLYVWIEPGVETTSGSGSHAFTDFPEAGPGSTPNKRALTMTGGSGRIYFSIGKLPNPHDTTPPTPLPPPDCDCESGWTSQTINTRYQFLEVAYGGQADVSYVKFYSMPISLSSNAPQEGPNGWVSTESTWNTELTDQELIQEFKNHTNSNSKIVLTNTSSRFVRVLSPNCIAQQVRSANTSYELGDYTYPLLTGTGGYLDYLLANDPTWTLENESGCGASPFHYTVNLVSTGSGTCDMIASPTSPGQGLSFKVSHAASTGQISDLESFIVMGVLGDYAGALISSRSTATDPWTPYSGSSNRMLQQLSGDLNYGFVGGTALVKETTDASKGFCNNDTVYDAATSKDKNAVSLGSLGNSNQWRFSNVFLKDAWTGDEGDRPFYNVYSELIQHQKGVTTNYYSHNNTDDTSLVFPGSVSVQGATTLTVTLEAVSDIAQHACAADLTGDIYVDGRDLAMVLGAWGSCAPGCVGDTNEDGFVDGTDIAFVLGNWQWAGDHACSD